MAHFLRRILFYLAALWVAATLDFLIPRLIPGDPVLRLYANAQGRIDPKQLPALRASFGLSNKPLWQQYFDYLNNMVHGNFGLSFKFFPSPVSEVIKGGIFWTLILLGITTILGFAIGTLLGIIAAWRRGGLLDRIFPPVMVFVQSMPYFFVALALLYFLAFKLQWFPLNGGFSPDYLDAPVDFNFIMDRIYHAILPAMSILLVSLGGWMLGMRNAMLNTLGEDYVLMAEAKGLPERRIMLTYAARNAILPSVTNLAIVLGFVVSGSILTEYVFSYPGIGLTLVEAVGAGDYPLVQALFLIIATAVLVANFLADIAYAILDPRVREGRA
ncbi:MAG TPA: ABC transporter permease [Ktedonobacterales bacterium]|nr:ABC transporter permease [Ktedonobacterales bacterium]